VTKLPGAANDRIARTLDAARLGQRDREDVGAELAAHLEDALESGRELDALLRDFDSGEPAAAGALIGRSVRRRRHARIPLLRAGMALTLGIAVVYAGLFARLRLGPPERTWDSPASAAAAWRADHADERAAFETVLNSMYTRGENGRLTAAGLRAFQAWKGKTGRTAPSLASIALEPAFFSNAARRGEASLEFDRFLRLAELPGPDFEIEREALLSDRSRALRFVALQVPLDRLAARRAATFRRTP
jgi:hypothetical protein